MSKTYIFIAMLSISLSIFSCNPTNSEKRSDQNEEILSLDKQWAKSFIDSINIKFAEHLALGDSAALASLYWPDAELLLDYSEAVNGKNIVNAWGAAIRMGVKDMTFSTTDITGSTTFIIETGRYEMKGGNKSLIDKGKYIVVWENRNGEWKLYRDIGSTSMPAPK